MPIAVSGTRAVAICITIVRTLWHDRRTARRSDLERNMDVSINPPVFNSFRFVPTSVGQTGQWDNRDKRDMGQDGGRLSAGSIASH